ncbi:hypothetical protein HMPREF1316_2349 [Olsenella profusa F0195]|uniref:Uncharacterized protein n=1 Tax=Olsenella profusa F0195 TaxID=1125712 RepID=U2TNM3_9ACTN|nr:hypothetical protein HMPREF1316_2349 [Olsenella profusa F0195]
MGRDKDEGRFLLVAAIFVMMGLHAREGVVPLETGMLEPTPTRASAQHSQVIDATFEVL